jgi:hypothetical protein
VTSTDLVWILQHPEQSQWLLHSLRSSLQLAASLGLYLTLTFHSTRGALTPSFSRTSSHTAINAVERATKVEAREGGRKGSLQVGEAGEGGALEELKRMEGAGGAVSFKEGRPDVESEVRRVVEKAGGETLVVGAFSLPFFSPLCCASVLPK